MRRRGRRPGSRIYTGPITFVLDRSLLDDPNGAAKFTKFKKGLYVSPNSTTIRFETESDQPELNEGDAEADDPDSPEISSELIES